MSLLEYRHVVARVESLDGETVARPLFDEGPLPLGAGAPEPGCIVEIELDESQRPGALQVLARPDSARAALYDVMERRATDPCYPRQVEDEVGALLDEPGIEDAALDDLTSLPFITIDNDDSRDLDQALYIESSPTTGGFVVYYALADASYYVRPGSALLAEALRRGVTYYFPGISVPMLPPALSEGIISLNEQVPRRSLVFVMTLDDKGHPQETCVHRSRIRSRAKLTYRGVQAYYDEPSRSPLLGTEYQETLDLLKQVGLVRVALADERDVVQFNRVDTLVTLPSDDGPHFTVSTEHRLDVCRWNEQVSLLCNIEGARLLEPGSKPHAHVQPVFRVHDSPEPVSLDHLEASVVRLVALHNLPAHQWCWRRASGESPAEYLARLPRSGPHARLTATIEHQILLTNRRSVFTSDPGRHYALGVDPYCRFSAPMREIVGIFTHKELFEKLGLTQPSPDEEDEALRTRVINAANRGKERQRLVTKEVTKLAVDQLLARDLTLPVDERPRHRGTIWGMSAKRLYVHLDEPPIEMKLYLDHLEGLLGCRFVLQEGHAELRPEDPAQGPHLRLGDGVCLRTHSYDEKRRRWHLVPVVCPDASAPVAEHGEGYVHHGDVNR